LLKVSGALENQLSIVEHVAKRMGLEPAQEETQEVAEMPTEQASE